MLANCTVQTTIPYLDYNRARQFYEDVLGFTPSQEVPGGVAYECGSGTSFVLYPSQFAGTAQNTAMGFLTNDIEGEISSLQSRGIVFEEYNLPDLKTVNGSYTGRINEAVCWRWFWSVASDRFVVTITTNFDRIGRKHHDQNL
jgi:predicted enzyme related to lactoylglutathione lyase